jgi:hypothetical protein
MTGLLRGGRLTNPATRRAMRALLALAALLAAPAARRRRSGKGT